MHIEDILCISSIILLVVYIIENISLVGKYKEKKKQDKNKEKSIKKIFDSYCCNNYTLVLPSKKKW